MNYEAIDRALGQLGRSPEPLDCGLSPQERDRLLEESLCFPDLPLPTGELADWAVELGQLDKVPVVMAAVAVVEAALSAVPPGRADIPYVETLLTELHLWLKSDKTIDDLRRLGDLWWTTTRNAPDTADTRLGDAAMMAWFVAGYDPEGHGNPPEDPEQLGDWLAEAADNVRFIVDVFSFVQQEVGSELHELLVRSVRDAVGAWRDRQSDN